MRLPAVAIAAAFACGILLGLHPAVAQNTASFLILSCSFAVEDSGSDVKNLPRPS
jgi:hypothetical protein